MAETVIIEGRDLTRRFGGLAAVSQCNLTLGKGDLNGLIGPNGAGKTTVFNLITGVLKPTSGAIFVAGENLTGRSPWRFAASGIARTFQNIRLFNELSVLENVMCGAHRRHGEGLLASVLRTRRFLRSEQAIAERAEAALELVGLAAFRHHRAGDLSYGDQRRVEIARALATEPVALMLDEPAAGLNPTETAVLIDLIRRLNAEFELTILLVEHDMRLVMELCRHIQVLNRGQTIAVGTASEIQSHPAVVEAYLGVRRKGIAHA